MDNREISTFGEVINLFKQEIEIRTDFKNLETIVSQQEISLGRKFKFDISQSKLHRQFYTDTKFFNDASSKIFSEMKKREEFPNIKLETRDLEDRSLEIKIIQVDSKANQDSQSLVKETENGDFADIKESLTNR